MEEQIEKVGIEEIKNAIGAGYGLTHRVIEITSEASAGGKKVTIPELIGSAGYVYDVAKAALKGKEIYAQVLDMDDQEQADLEAWVQETFNVPNEKTKRIIVQSLVVVMELGELVIIITE